MLKVMNRLKPATKSLVFVACLAAIGACTPIFKNHGYVPPAEDLAEIKVGVDTRDTVEKAIGAPGASGVVRDSGFYYVRSRVRHYGPKRPEVVSRELVAISFDQRGVVSNIERFGLEDGLVIPLERRVTDSNVQDKGFLRQLLGNIGNFNPANIPGAN
ncbi:MULTISPECIES: outer membrane protein assembly factor BamE [unclassified Ruegeria]|uniref:outer membrane protein assembly factor BamE n=1 Tax=unclassified Ruegeria TaxID=2625375 RepID=UPI001488F85C|nr:MULTISPECIES: outer membrane protein assembly factor BamE [unclassified Ruegeria]NOD34124.1 outer membrane protein assembly factor BamE [Ruegeria sp. HKCCD7296]NOE41148.1 outer membrane protein assembly factor BamE [Ruegeria sp. HKCCD7319]